MSASKMMINAPRTNNDAVEEDSVDVDDASLPLPLPSLNENDDMPEGADAGASAGAGYDIDGLLMRIICIQLLI